MFSLFQHKKEKLITEEGHCFVVSKIMSQKSKVPVELIINFETNSQLWDGGGAWDPVGPMRSISNRQHNHAFEKAFLSLIINGDRYHKNSNMDLFDIYETLDTPKVNNIFSHKEISDSFYESIRAFNPLGEKYLGPLSCFTKRYSAEFKTTPNSLLSLLKGECYGKVLHSEKDTKNIIDNLRELLVAIHIDIRNDKTNEWIRIKTFEFNHEHKKGCTIM